MKWFIPCFISLFVGVGLVNTLKLKSDEQKKRYFPLPDYSNSNLEKVILEIYGQEIDENYSKMLMENSELDLEAVILLDRVQKKLSITKDAAVLLRKQNLIEGRKPNYFVSAFVAKITGQKAAYTKNKGFSKIYYLDFLLKAINEHGSLSRKDIDDLLIDKLPDIYNKKQKKVKVNNLIAELRRKGEIKNIGSDAKPKCVLNEEIY